MYGVRYVTIRRDHETTKKGTVTGERGKRETRTATVRSSFSVISDFMANIMDVLGVGARSRLGKGWVTKAGKQKGKHGGQPIACWFLWCWYCCLMAIKARQGQPLLLIIKANK